MTKERKRRGLDKDALELPTFIFAFDKETTVVGRSKNCYAELWSDGQGLGRLTGCLYSVFWLHLAPHLIVRLCLGNLLKVNCLSPTTTLFSC